MIYETQALILNTYKLKIQSKICTNSVFRLVFSIALHPVHQGWASGQVESGWNQDLPDSNQVRCT